ERGGGLEADRAARVGEERDQRAGRPGDLPPAELARGLEPDGGAGVFQRREDRASPRRAPVEAIEGPDRVPAGRFGRGGIPEDLLQRAGGCNAPLGEPPLGSQAYAPRGVPQTGEQVFVRGLE